MNEKQNKLKLQHFSQVMNHCEDHTKINKCKKSWIRKKKENISQTHKAIQQKEEINDDKHQKNNNVFKFFQFFCTVWSINGSCGWSINGSKPGGSCVCSGPQTVYQHASIPDGFSVFLRR